MKFETLVRVKFKTPPKEEMLSYYRQWPDQFKEEDDRTFLFGWKLFHAVMSTIFMTDEWESFWEVFQDSSREPLELYFNRQLSLVAPAFKFYIDMSPLSAIVVSPQQGELIFAKIYFEGDKLMSTEFYEPKEKSYELEMFFRRYFSWVWLRPQERAKLDLTMRKILGVSLEEFDSVIEK